MNQRNSKNSMLTTQISQVHNLGGGLEKVPLPEVDLQRGILTSLSTLESAFNYTSQNTTWSTNMAKKDYNSQILSHPPGY